MKIFRGLLCKNELIREIEEITRLHVARLVSQYLHFELAINIS